MKNAIESTPIAPDAALDVNEVLDAIETFIKQRPGLDFANYGNLKPYRAEIRSIAKDKTRATKALAEVRRSVEHDPALLADSFTRAFSGRLEWVPVECPDHGVGPCSCERSVPAHLEYTTGQYFPTEYRKAAASVLETYKSLLAQKWSAQHPVTFAFKTITEVKEANAVVGGHWFDRGAMSFFRSRIESKLLTRASSGRQLFITSEQFDDNAPRKYTVREALPDGSVNTVGKFQGYATLQDARDAVTQLA